MGDRVGITEVTEKDTGRVTRTRRKSLLRLEPPRLGRRPRRHVTDNPETHGVTGSDVTVLDTVDTTPGVSPLPSLLTSLTRS